MASFITNLATGAAQTAHAQASALLAQHEAKQGDKLPLTVHLKEDDAGKPFNLTLTGKNIIVRLDLLH